MRSGSAKPLAFLLLPLVLLASACGNSAPTNPTTPMPLALVAQVTLTRLDPPPGVKNAARASFMVLEAQGRVANLTGVGASTSFGPAVVVTGFTPRVLQPQQSTTFDVTLTSVDELSCSDELYVFVTFDNGDQRGDKGVFFSCSNRNWPF